jgi:hypothetical protein
MRNRLVWIAAAAGVTAGIVGFGVLKIQQGVRPASKFTNIVVLKDLTDQQIQDTMELWTRQVGLTCDDCHAGEDYASDERHEKATARQMYQMVQSLNQQEFFRTSGRTADCFLCHKGVKYIPAQVNK